MDEAEWEQRVAAAWASIDEHDEADFLDLIEALASVRPSGDGIADFERACSFDSLGHSDRAVPLYRSALAQGLTGVRRRRAVIQMASSLRNLGQPQVTYDMLTAELAAASDPLDDAIHALLALTLTDLGREREAVSVAVAALARHLPRYQRSMANYARLLVEPDPTDR